MNQSSKNLERIDPKDRIDDIKAHLYSIVIYPCFRDYMFIIQESKALNENVYFLVANLMPSDLTHWHKTWISALSMEMNLCNFLHTHVIMFQINPYT